MSRNRSAPENCAESQDITPVNPDVSCEMEQQPDLVEGKESAPADQPAALGEPAEPKYSVEALRKNCLKIFGVTVSTFDGATFGLKGDFTKEKMKAILDEWLKKEVRT